MKQVEYQYQNLSIPGGGFVTGFRYHPKNGTLYCRTDIGGCYRYEPKAGVWIPLIDHSDFRGQARMETFPLSIAVNSRTEEDFYVACGDGSGGLLAVSHDYGQHFTEYFPIPAAIHGNHSGRGTGERLWVDGNRPEVIYFGSQENGLLCSENGGQSWSSLLLGAQNETEITFVHVDERYRMPDGRSARILVATTGAQNAADPTHRGQGLYLSNDGGASFLPLQEPKQDETAPSRVKGFVGVRCAADEEYYYISFTSSGPWDWCGFANYSPDSNDSFDGRVCRYHISAEGKVVEFADITPWVAKDKALPEADMQGFKDCLGCGIGGIATTLMVPGLIIASTINRANGDMVVRSEDYGASWSIELDHKMLERYQVTIPYMKPEYNGGVAPLHWLTSLEINPLNPQEAIFNTGISVYMTRDLQSEYSIWRTEAHGIEETVHLNLYSPPAGDAILIDILGDLGGFIFTDTKQLPENSFADPEGNRYITCCNADYPDRNPNLLVVSARGNWTGKTKGGLIYSEDQGKHFLRLPCPYGISKTIDCLLQEIEKPNVNSGWGAISADGTTICWTVGDRNALPASAVVYTRDKGAHWEKSRIYDLQGREITGEMVYPPRPQLKRNDYQAFWNYQESILGLKVMADRVNPRRFYGLGDHSKLYVSEDGAESFHQLPVEAVIDGKPAEYPLLGLAGIDMSYHGEVRVESEKEGVLWLAMEEGGLWRLEYSAEKKCFFARRITKDGDIVLAQGMGKGKAAADGTIPCKTLFVGGTLQGEYGFFRSFDEGISWERINTGQQMFGELKYMTGDPRSFGRVYIATGTRGVFWGEPAK